MAKSDTKKLRSPQIEVCWNGDVPEATYFKREEYSIIVSPKDTIRLMDSLKVKKPETLIKALGNRFALKEPHNSFVKIQTSLDRRGIPYERV